MCARVSSPPIRWISARRRGTFTTSPMTHARRVCEHSGRLPKSGRLRKSGSQGDSVMNRRIGATLIEVLVAVFVCAFGLIALMTLFPVGAMNMAQAIKDDRTAHAAANATAILRTIWRVSLASGNPNDPGLMPFNSGNPVFLDPLGAQGAGSLPGGIPRIGLPTVGNFSAQERWFSLLDDMNFLVGPPKDGGPG